MAFSRWTESPFSAILLNLCLISRGFLCTTKMFPGAIFTKENTRLRGYTLKSYVVPSQISCAHDCLSNAKCYSTNFKEILSHGQHGGLCELNSKRVRDVNDLRYEHGCVYARYPKDGMVSLATVMFYICSDFFS